MASQVMEESRVDSKNEMKAHSSLELSKEELNFLNSLPKTLKDYAQKMIDAKNVNGLLEFIEEQGLYRKNYEVRRQQLIGDVEG